MAQKPLKKAKPKKPTRSPLPARSRSRKSKPNRAEELDWEGQFRSLIHAAPMGVYRTTPEGRILLANPALIEMLGYSSFDELASRNLEEEGFEIEYPRKKFRMLIERDGQVRGFEAAWKRRDGSTIYLSENARAVCDSQGKTLYYEGSVEDISQRKLVEEQMRQAKEKAEEANRLKSDFLANAGHELRTPLGGLMGMLELLLGTKLDEQQKRFAQAAFRSAQSLSTLINDLLDFSRLKRQSVIIMNDRFNLEQIVRDAAQLLSSQATEKGLTLVVNYAEQAPRHFVSDATRIYQILCNLLHNAVKFTHQGQVNLTVQCVQKDSLSARMKILIHDTGIGIPADKYQVIFEKFTQLDFDTKRRYGGMGLGLAISMYLAKLMDGSIEVESQLGHGSTFALNLELRLSQTQPEETTGQSPVTATAAAPAVTTPKALVVDDNEINREVVAAMLSRLGYQVEVAATGQIALELFGSTSYPIVFLDCQMPDLDGFDVTRQIRQRERNTERKTKIVAMTAFTLSEDRERCLAVGMDDYIAKPATIHDFESVLKRLGMPVGSPIPFSMQSGS